MVGYERDSVPGLLLSFRLISDINERDNAETQQGGTTKGKQRGRRSKARANFAKKQ